MKTISHSMERSVRIFSILLVSIQCIFGQSYDEQQLDSILYEHGEFGGYFILKNSNHPEFKSREKYIDEIMVKDASINNKVIQRIFNPLTKSYSIQYSNQTLSHIRSRYPFIPDATDINYGLLEDEQLGVFMIFDPDFNSHFSGIGGVGKVDGGSWNAAGEINVHLENTWATATITDIFWKKTENEDQFILLSHEDPFPYGLPFGYKVEFIQDLQNELFVHNISRGSFSIQLNNNGLWYFGGSKEELTPMNSADSLEIGSFRSESIFANYKMDTRNDRWMPLKGTAFDMTFEGGSISEDGQELSLKINLHLIQYLKINPNLSLKISSWDRGVWVNEKSTIHQGMMIKYGGHGTLRGYNENMFKSQAVSITKFDLLFTFSKTFHLYSFFDHSSNYEHTNAHSYGVGIRQKTQNALIDISFAWPVDESFSGGKVHIKFTSLLD